MTINTDLLGYIILGLLLVILRKNLIIKKLQGRKWYD